MKRFFTHVPSVLFFFALLLGGASTQAQTLRASNGALVSHTYPQTIGGILLSDGITNAVLANGLFMSQDVFVITPKGKQMATWTGDASAYLGQLTSAVYNTTYDIYDVKTVVDATTGLVTLKLTYTPAK